MSNKETYNVFNLNSLHKELFTKYITFIKNKQNKFIKEVNNYIEDFHTNNVTEMMYGKDDIDDMFIKIQEYIQKSMDKEISYYLNMNAIFVQLLLHDAEKQTVSLQVETSQVENMNNIKEMNDFVNSLSNLTLPDTNSNNKLGKLGSISNTANLIENYETLKHDNDILNEKNKILENKIELLQNENNNLNNINNQNSNEIENLRNQIKSLSSNINNNNFDNNNKELLNKLEEECKISKKNYDEQMQKYQQLLKDFDKKVNESTQFKTLKKILQEKNTLIVQLKTKISNYEEKK